MNKKMVTIIIPVYNGEKHIIKCIENIMQQTYFNIEIIVLNDGSTDKTKELLNNIEEKYKKVKVVNKNNSGVSNTRNLGIKMARGEYIAFLDSDDFMEKTAIEDMITKIKNDNIDMLIYGFKVVGSNNRFNDTEVLKKLYVNDASKNDIVKSVISTKNNIYGYAWRALYSKKLILDNNIFFPEGIKISEDYMFFLNAINSSKRILIDYNEYYLYNINEESMSIKYIPSLLNDMLYVNKWMYDNIVKDKESLVNGYYCCMSNTYLRAVQNIVRNKNSNLKESIKLIKAIKKENNFKKYINKVWYKFNCFPLKSFISIIMFRFNLELIYVFLFYLKERGFFHEKDRNTNFS